MRARRCFFVRRSAGGHREHFRVEGHWAPLFVVVAAEIGSNRVEIVLRLSLIAIFRQLRKETHKCLLCQILRFLAVCAVKGAVLENVAIIFANERVKRRVVALLHFSNGEKICVHDTLLSCMRLQNVLPAILVALHTITTLREKRIATAENFSARMKKETCVCRSLKISGNYLPCLMEVRRPPSRRRRSWRSPSSRLSS